MLKRLFSILTISLVLTGSFFSVYNINYPVYADDTTDGWTQVTTNQQLVEAFRYYCKSRDLTIDGSIADGVTKFTTNAFNGICNTLGIDVTALQAHLKYRTDGNAGLRFLFDSTGISLYNSIFAQFLQDNNLAVGDSANETDNTVYSGRYFTDDNGNSCLVFIIQNLGTFNKPILAYGTNYKYDVYQLVNFSATTTDPYIYNLTFNINNNVYELPLRGKVDYYGQLGKRLQIYPNGYRDNTYYEVYATTSTYVNKNGYPCIIYDSTNDKLFLGAYGAGRINGSATVNFKFAQPWLEIPNDTQSANVYLTTNNTVINNNVYEGDTIINNPDGGSDPDPDPEIPDPNPNPTPDPPTIPDDGGWQDFSLPEMPNDWLIYGMEKKFPFDIPFNILFALSLLNHEPEIPKFEGDIDLQVCTWHYDIDLTPFDDIATMLRKFEVLGFIIGLAILTKNLINWG